MSSQGQHTNAIFAIINPSCNQVGNITDNAAREGNHASQNDKTGDDSRYSRQLTSKKASWVQD